MCDLPYKIGNTIFFNLVLYFMTNLRRTPSAFFTFILFSFFTTLVMSTLFRTFGAMSRTLVQALVPSAIIILALNIFTGFVVPPTAMVPWFRWINYIDPIAYAFESLMVNEFWDRDFDCSAFVPRGPGFENIPGLSRVCNVVGAQAGSKVVRGEDYLRLSFGYEKSHLWRYVLWTGGFLRRTSSPEIGTNPSQKFRDAQCLSSDIPRLISRSVRYNIIEKISR